MDTTPSELPVDKKAALLAGRVKQIDVDGLPFTLGIKKLKWGEYTAAQKFAEAEGDEPNSDPYNTRLSMSLFTAGVIDPVLTMEDLEQVDVDLFVDVAQRILEHSGLTPAAAKEAAKSGSPEQVDERADGDASDDSGDGAEPSADS
jgi:hypothetical protein